MYTDPSGERPWNWIWNNDPPENDPSDSDEGTNTDDPSDYWDCDPDRVVEIPEVVYTVHSDPTNITNIGIDSGFGPGYGEMGYFGGYGPPFVGGYYGQGSQFPDAPQWVYNYKANNLYGEPGLEPLTADIVFVFIGEGIAVGVGAAIKGVKWTFKAVKGWRWGKRGAAAVKAAQVGRGSSRILNTTAKQLQSKFKHATDFGLKGNWNKTAAGKFNSAINQHINSSGVRVINGTYRGQPAIHYLNPSTRLNVISTPQGQFWSGWRLTPTQLRNVVKHGGLK